MEVGVAKVTKRRSEGWNNPFIQRLPFPLKRCRSLHSSSPLSFQEPLGKMDLNTKVCVCLQAHKNRACVARSSSWVLGYNMDILWRSEDQHVNHINYTPWWKHRWSSNKEKSAGFAGNLNHIFSKELLSGSSRCRNACTDSGGTCHVASLCSLFPEATAVISGYKLYRDQQSSGNHGNMRQPSMLKWSRAAARVWPRRNSNIHCGYDTAPVTMVCYRWWLLLQPEVWRTYV